MDQNPDIYSSCTTVWTLLRIWYEKLPQNWGIWQKCRVKSPIVLNYPCTGVVRLKINKCIILIVIGMQMYKQILLYVYSVVINAYVATYCRMYLCYLPVMQDFNWCWKSLGSFLFETSESLDHYNLLLF